MNIILSCNDNPTYRGFVEPVCNYYMKLGYDVHLALVGFDLDVSCTSKIIYPLIEGVDSGIQAKMARSFYGMSLENKVYTLMDIDQFLIRTDWHNSLTQKSHDALMNETLDLIAVGANGYVNTPHVGKWPMAFTTLTPKGFSKILDCDKSDWESFVIKYKTISDPIDGKESFSNHFSGFSDESFYRYRVERVNANVQHEDMPNSIHMRWFHRLDRTEAIMMMFQNPHFGQGFWSQTSLTNDQIDMIRSGFFFDCCPARPYENHKQLIDEIIQVSLEMHNV